jgi:hypothetical protein
MAENFNDFLNWERTTRDTIDFKKIYVDLAGSLNSGLVLSELIYWYLPDKAGNRNKLRCRKKGKLWIAVPRWQWWERARLSPDQADRALRELVNRGLIEKARFKFNGTLTVHIRILEDHFIKAWMYMTENPPPNPYHSDNVDENDDSGFYLANTRPDLANARPDLAESGKSLTENTSETYTEIYKKELTSTFDKVSVDYFSENIYEVKEKQGEEQETLIQSCGYSVPQEITQLSTTPVPYNFSGAWTDVRDADWDEWLTATVKAFGLKPSKLKGYFDGTGPKDKAVGHCIKVASTLRKLARMARENPAIPPFYPNDVLIMSRWLKSMEWSYDVYENVTPNIFIKYMIKYFENIEEIRVDDEIGLFKYYDNVKFGNGGWKWLFEVLEISGWHELREIDCGC